MAKVTEKRIEGTTPNGGTYSIAYFQDKDGQPESQDKAVRVEIVEFASDGVEVWRTYGDISPQGDTTA